MVSNTTLLDLSYEPFLNTSKYYLFVWSVINFLKCLYVTVSIINKRIRPLFVATIFTGVTVFYIVQTRDSTWLLLLLILDLMLIVYTFLTTRDGIFLLALLSTTIYFLKPFAFIVDVFVILFMGIDIPIIFWENSPLWSMMYLNCLAASVAIAHWNSHGPNLKTFLTNWIFICFFWAVSWNATDKVRSISVCIIVVVYVLEQFNREVPLKFGSTEFSKLRSNVLELDMFK